MSKDPAHTLCKRKSPTRLTVPGLLLVPERFYVVRGTPRGGWGGLRGGYKGGCY
jgi:hypothetical protein